MKKHISPLAKYIKARLEDVGIDSRLKYGNDPVSKMKDNFVFIRIIFNQCGEIGKRYTIGDYITVECEASIMATFYYKEKSYEVGDRVREIVLGALGKKIGEEDYYYAEDGFFQTNGDMWGTDMTALSKMITAKWTNKMPKVSVPLTLGVDLYQVILENKD